MAPITKLARKTKKIFVDRGMLEGLEIIKQKYIEALILLSLNWHVEFHVHRDASLLIMGLCCLRI